MPGEGIGSNYWDLLPFGGEDALATIYYYDALLDLAELEEQIVDAPAVVRRHRRRRLRSGRSAQACPGGEGLRHAAVLEREDRPVRHRRSRRRTARLRVHLPQQRGRLLRLRHAGAGQIDPRLDLPASGSSRATRRPGADIYHWRFGPRSTTKRNLDYYFWALVQPGSRSRGATRCRTAARCWAFRITT